MSMLQVLSILRAFWKRILFTLILLVGAAAFGIHLWPKAYVATAILQINHTDKNPLGGREGPNDLVTPQSYIPTQIELIMSRVVLMPVIERLQLTQDKEFTRGFSGSPNALREAVLKNLQDSLLVQPGKGSDLLYISASYPYPDKAAQISNAIADQYLKQERQRASEPVDEKHAGYVKDLAELKVKADAAQDHVTAFRKEHNLTDGDGGTTDMETTALEELERKYVAAKQTRLELEAHQIKSDGGSAQVLESAPIQALRARLTIQQEQMADLRITLGPRNPSVVELQSQIDATRHSLDEEVSSIASNARISLARARDLEMRYKAEADTQQAKVVDHRAVQGELQKLLVEMTSDQANYKHALELAGADQSLIVPVPDNTDVSLISRADPPAKAEKPNKIKLLAVACAGALGFALGWPFAWELLLDRRLRCRDDLERNFGMPVLAQFGRITPV